MAYEEIVPDAELMESMRAVGYSLKTAIADICDNSIAANSKQVLIEWDVQPEAFVFILDDGEGMSRDTLRVAMKLAGRSPLQARSQSDLGRFGLGLKTASLSQARSLTVVSLKDGYLASAQWDLDHLRATQTWSLRWLEPAEAAALPGFDKLVGQSSGTLVVWQKLDLLLDPDDAQGVFLASKFDEVSNHLGLVFHRFLNSKAESLEMRLNGQRLPHFDPFLEGDSGVVDRGETTIRVHGEPVTVRPFILPSPNKMSRSQRDKAQFDSSRMRDSQGFYIYRNKRLLTWGTWFRMVRMDESGKLARVRVDTGNSLDAHWKLGIMKSTVQPPKPLLDALKRLVPEIVENSTRASRGRSVVESNSEGQVWKVRELGDKAFELIVNLEHPLISGLTDRLDQTQRRTFLACLRLIESSFPATYVHQRLASDNPMREGLVSDVDLIEVAEEIFAFSREMGITDDLEAWKMVEAIEPFRSNTQLLSRLRAIRNGESK